MKIEIKLKNYEFCDGCKVLGVDADSNAYNETFKWCPIYGCIEVAHNREHFTRPEECIKENGK